MFAKTFSAQSVLLDANIIDIEIDISNGLHSFSVAGLPDKAVEESRDRVSSAIKNSGFTPPKSKNQKVVVSLAPAELKKEGSVFDVGIAMAYLLASQEIKFNPDKKLFLGELSLDGKVRPVLGVLPLIRHAKKMGFEEAYVPKENVKEAALIDGIKIFGVSNLSNLIEHLKDVSDFQFTIEPKTEIAQDGPKYLVDFRDIRGQDSAKRGLEIAASGKHNIAMYGPPGTGKTMLARAFSGILPQLSFEEMLEVTSIHSVSGHLNGPLITNPPFRSPHHTSSYVALIGGGANPKPGEVTLANKGVLFLDEFPEFDRRVVESLRQPLEDNEVNISRAKSSATFPANFILIAAMNPCPCGNWGSDKRECTCSPHIIEKYQKKLSGPIIDRIDLWIEVTDFDHSKLLDDNLQSESSIDIKKKVEKVREVQLNRFKETKTNSEMTAPDIEKYINLENRVKDLLNLSAQKLNLSPRSYHRVLKLARTIADMEESENIQEKHILEALQYRPKNKV